MCHHTEIRGLLFMKKETDEIKTPGFYVSLDWNKTIQKLSDEEAGQLLKNMYNYALDQPLNQCSYVVETICDMVIYKTIEINKIKYVEKCKVNSKNGALGGRPPKNVNNYTEEPNGLIDNPEKAKYNNSNNNKPNIIKDNKINEYINKMEKLIEIDNKTIQGDDAIDFVIMLKELNKYLGWDRLKLIIFYTKEIDVEKLLIEYDMLGCLKGILYVKKDYNNFLDKLIK